MTGSIVDYTSLQTAILAWLARASDADLVTQAPTFIQLFEASIKGNPLFRVREEEQLDTDTMSGQTYALPTGFLEARSLKLNTNPYQFLDYVTPGVFWQTYPSNYTGRPKVFTIEASNLLFGPSPDSAYTFDFLYLKFTGLSAGSPTNWLILNYPNIYLWGSLIEAADYIDNDRQIAKWKARLDEAISRLEKADWRSRWSGSALVMKSDTGSP
jgi:hypothetical protein